MKLSKTFVIRAPINKVWHEVADNFEQVSTWSRLVPESTAIEGSSEYQGLDHASGRVCETPFGANTTEQINHYADESETLKEIGWRVTGMPRIIEFADNIATIEAQGNDRTIVSFNIDFKLKAWGLPAVVFLRPYMGRVLGDLAVDLTHYIENGEPSPEKIKALQKRAARASA